MAFRKVKGLNDNYKGIFEDIKIHLIIIKNEKIWKIRFSFKITKLKPNIIDDEIIKEYRSVKKDSN